VNTFDHGCHDPDPDLRILRFYDTANKKRSGSYIGSLKA
jgi:hypothetical protein